MVIPGAAGQLASACGHAGPGVFPRAAYTLWMIARLLWRTWLRQVRALTDINAREFLMLAALAIAVL